MSCNASGSTSGNTATTSWGAWCGACFQRADGLQKHVQSTHASERPVVQCDECPATFTTSTAKARHMREKHGSLRAQDVCELCNKTFRRRSEFVAHMHSHTLALEE